jgi:acylphosphatase
VSETLRLHALITGRVQGVGFRYFVLRQAQQLGLSGYVRNAGRQVEVVAEGAPRQLQALLVQLSLGPPAARVDNVQHSLAQANGGFNDFQVSSTAR